MLQTREFTIHYIAAHTHTHMHTIGLQTPAKSHSWNLHQTFGTKLEAVLSPQMLENVHLYMCVYVCV